jgi:hypothetical protein
MRIEVHEFHIHLLKYTLLLPIIGLFQGNRLIVMI